MKYVLLCFLILAPQYSFAVFDQLSKREIRTLIGNFPEKGSVEELADDSLLLDYQARRTKEECELAGEQSSFNAQEIFVKPHGPLEKKEFQLLKFKVQKLMAKVGLNILRAKMMFKRQRPFVRNPEIQPCIKLERSSSYPSGHTATGRAVGLFLAFKYPDRAEEIMKVADQVGENRMIGGVHHPSDIIAGRKIGEEVFHRNLPGKLTVLAP